MDAGFEFRPFSADARNFTSTRNKRCDKEKYNFFKYFSIRTDSLVGYKAIKKERIKKKERKKERKKEKRTTKKEKKKERGKKSGSTPLRERL